MIQDRSDKAFLVFREETIQDNHGHLVLRTDCTVTMLIGTQT